MPLVSAKNMITNQVLKTTKSSLTNFKHPQLEAWENYLA
jgi:hypothetical protein